MKTMFQLIATSTSGHKTVVNSSNDSNFLYQILDAREGITWVNCECCSLEVVQAK